MGTSLDFAQTYSDIIGYLGFFGALIGWLYQWKRASDNKQIELRGLWEDLSVIKAVMGEIEQADSKTKRMPYEIYQAHGELAILFRSVLTRIISKEPKMTLETINKWRKVGKLGSDWQQKCAMAILLSDELTKKELDEIDEKYSTWEQLKHNSALASYDIEEDEEELKLKNNSTKFTHS